MYNTIYHMSEYSTPRTKLTEEDIITEHNWFVHLIAEYVDASAERDNDIQKLYDSFDEETKKYVELYYRNGQFVSIEFKKGFKQAYFKKKYMLLKKAANTITLEDFTKDNLATFNIISLAEDKYSAYVLDDTTEGLWCFDKFVRLLDDEGSVWYFGNTIDYSY